MDVVCGAEWRTFAPSDCERCLLSAQIISVSIERAKMLWMDVYSENNFASTMRAIRCSTDTDRVNKPPKITKCVHTCRFLFAAYFRRTDDENCEEVRRFSRTFDACKRVLLAFRAQWRHFLKITRTKTRCKKNRVKVRMKKRHRKSSALRQESKRLSTVFEACFDVEVDAASCHDSWKEILQEK